MRLVLIDSTGPTEHPVEEAAELLARSEGIVWLDVPAWDEHAEHLLQEVFHFHPRALEECARRNTVPNLHVYRDHVFLVMHAPQRGAVGHVHSVELDQFIGDRYLVTVHGPLSAAADPAVARVEVDALMKRLTTGRIHPHRAEELAHVLNSSIAERLRECIASLTRDLWDLEYLFQASVGAGRGGRLQDPQQFLDELFRTRHGFLVARTQAVMSREVLARMRTLRVFGDGDAQKRLGDAVDQFAHLSVMADGERDNLQGTIEFYQARTNTELTTAAERLAVISLITLPVTAVSSVLGMNVIVNSTTQPVELTVAVLAMGVMSALLLRWAKRLGWW